MLKLYGIKNCDTVKRARRWLEQNSIEYGFHDYRVDGLSPELLDSFESKLGWDAMLNRRSTSWRQLSDTDRQELNSDKAKNLMLAQPTLIKRPVLENGSELILGFSPELYKNLQ